jgi:tRNA threonylcarbamoyladenosine biosynthesis protein TsaB
MNVLAFDSSMDACSVCVFNAEHDRFYKLIKPMKRGQAEMLVPLIKDVLESSALSFDDIDFIVTAIGPGAFTGLRISLSTAKALGLALNVSVKGFTTLEAIAADYFEKESLLEDQQLLVLLETKRADFYMQIFDSNNNQLTEEMALPYNEILEFLKTKQTVVIGDAGARFNELIAGQLKEDLIYNNSFTLVDPEMLINMGMKQDDFKSAEPLYLREADVSKSKKEYRIIEK